MNNYLFDQNKEYLSSLLAENASIGIIIGEPHSIDKVGASLALYLALTDAGKNVSIVSKIDPIVEVSNLVGVDRIKKQFDGKMDMLTVTFPCHGRQIQKVSYNIEGDYLHLNVFGGEDGLTFAEQDVKFTKKGSAPTLVFAVGASSYHDIESFVGAGGSRIVNIDFSNRNEMYGDVILVDPSFTTNSEIIAKLIEVLGLPVNVDTVQNVMDGVMAATHNLTSQQVGAFTFEAVSFSLRNGAQRKTQDTRAVQAPAPVSMPQQQEMRRDPFAAFTDPQGYQPYNPPQQSQPFPRPKNPFIPGSQQPMPRRNTMPQNSSPFGSFPPPTQQNNTNAFSNDFGTQNNFPQENAQNKINGVPEDWFAPKVYKGSTGDDNNNK